MQRYEQVACERCGGALKLESDGMYKCEYCGAVFKEKTIDNYLHAICNGIHSVLSDVLDTQYQNEIGSIRQNLFAAVRKRDINGDEIVDYCRSLKKKIGDNDFYANFYEVATYGTVTEINSFLNSINVAEQSEYAICDVLDYITNPVQAEVVPSVRWLIERAFKNNSQLKEKYDTKLDEDEGLIKAGVYDETLPRDVFLAYKSEDIEYVNELVEYLESQGLKCFLSSRNLKHGRNAKNLYEDRLYRAIDHCTVVVFVSTHLSRTMGGARNLELTYIEEQDKQNAPAEYRHNYMNMPNQYKKPRVEYLKEDYVTGAANEDFARVFFKGYQYRTSKEAVYNAVDEFRRMSPQAENNSEYKYCKNCGAKNLLSAEFCNECGVGQEFAKSEREYFAYKEHQLKEQAAQTIKNAEAELRRRQEDAQKQFAEELERRRQELEEEYKNKEEELKKREAEQRQKLKVKNNQNDYPTLSNYDKSKFEIEGTTLKKYLGKDTEVQIPQGVASIRGDAFENCNNLINIIIPEGVKVIEGGAFFGCASLTSIEIPSSVTYIEPNNLYHSTFGDCRGLERVKVDERNTFYRSDSNCLIEVATNKLVLGCKNSIIPSYVTSIGTGAFCGCIGLADILIPEGVASIGVWAFSGCNRLKSVTIPKSVKLIDGGAFQECCGMKSILILEGVSAIGIGAFYGCSNLKRVAIPNSVTSIGSSAFAFCSSLVHISIPNSVTSIGSYAFSDCSNIIEIENGVSYVDKWVVDFDCSAQSVSLRIDTVGIADAAFDCSDIIFINVPDSVTSIGNGAFRYCRSLTRVTIPNSITSIRDETFYGCSTLTSLTIPNSVTSIGDNAFYGCSSLTSITIPNSVTSIGFHAFSGCSNIIEIENGICYVGKWVIACDSLTKSVSLRADTVGIAAHAFKNCSSLSSIIIPNSVASIGKYAFSGCSGLERINVAEDNRVYHSKGNCLIKTATNELALGCKNSVIPNYVTTIGDYAFDGCSSLQSIYIPNSVTTIGNSAFDGCSSLQSIYIPNSVTSLGDIAFWGCKNLTIYCEIGAKPESWGEFWNYGCKVVWGYKGK